jgi:nitrite reductase/ring-hydroxylating ferredoxin subunit
MAAPRSSATVQPRLSLLCAEGGNWMPDRFLSRDRSQIICATHGALFDIATGYCTAGPCQGQHLTAKIVDIRDDQVWLR